MSPTGVQHGSVAGPIAYNSETCYLIEVPLAAKVYGSALPLQRKSRPQKGQLF